LSASEEGTVTVQIVDFTGRLVKQQFANVQKGINAISIELSQLSAGTYTVNMINGTTVAEPVRFVKQ
jgi:tRNA isopentenyl-2-thiomethyl-A-37 hydroxylase MiaE